MGEKQNKYLKLGLGEKKTGRPRKKKEQHIEEKASGRDTELKTLKKVAQDRNQYRKWINERQQRKMKKT